jgi:hypothetical protein
VRKLGKRMINTESGISPRDVVTHGWWGGEQKRTRCCLSKKEGPAVVNALIMVLMAGADAGGDSDFQLDSEEFHNMMEFLKVVLCRGHKGLKKQTGIDKVMTPKVFAGIIEKTVASLRAEQEGFLSSEQRAAMTDLDDGESADEGGYEEMSTKELKAECTDRNLKVDGKKCKKSALIARLEKYDEEHEDDDDDEDEEGEEEEEEEAGASDGTADGESDEEAEESDGESNGESDEDAEESDGDDESGEDADDDEESDEDAEDSD